MQKGDRRKANSVLNFIRRNTPTLLLDALMHAGLVAEAAGKVGYLMASDDRRADILNWLQQYRTSAALPGDREYRSNIDAPRARYDVRAAVGKVGRIECYDIHGSYGFD